MVDALANNGAPATNAENVAVRSDGNPFLVEELVSTAGGVIPDVVRDLLADRLRPVAGLADQVVKVAAVFGRPIGYDVLAGVVNVPHRALVQTLHQAVDEGVLVTDDDLYRFRHALLAELVRERLLPAERREIHAAIAQSLDGQDMAAPAREIAYHYQQAGDRHSAAIWLWRAAQEAESIPAPIEAADSYDELLTLLDQLSADAIERQLHSSLVDVLMRAVEANKLCGRTGRRLELLSAAHAAAADDGPEVRSRIFREQSTAYIDIGRAGEAVAPALEAVELLEPLGAGADLVDALAVASTAAGRVENLEDCEAFADRAVAVAESSIDPARQGVAISARGFARFFRGDYAGALEDFEHAQHLAQSAGDTAGANTAETRIIGLLSFVGREEDGISRAWKFLARADETGLGATTSVV